MTGNNLFESLANDPPNTYITKEMLKLLRKHLHLSYPRYIKKTLTRRILERCFRKTINTIKQDIHNQYTEYYDMVPKPKKTLRVKRYSKLKLPEENTIS